jgi:hypothetical protein
VDNNLFDDAVFQGIDLGQEAAALYGQCKICVVKLRAPFEIAV